jgi:hypothetical protein
MKANLLETKFETVRRTEIKCMSQLFGRGNTFEVQVTYNLTLHRDTTGKNNERK